MRGSARWESVGGRDVLVQDFEFAGTKRCTVEAKLRVLLWGGAGEADGPTGGRAPRLLHWRRPDGSTVDGERLTLERADAGDWSLVVEPVSETVTGIQVREARRSGK